MVDLSLSRPQQPEFHPGLMAARDKAAATEGVLRDLASEPPFERWWLKQWRERGARDTPIPEPYLYSLSSGTPSPVSLSAGDLSRLVNCGTTAFDSHVGITVTAEATLQPFIVVADAALNTPLKLRPDVYEVPAVRDDALAALGQLLEWTRTSPAELAPLLGASRRTVYNWLSRGQIGVRPASRIVRLHSLVGRLVATRDPLLVHSWLFLGDPRPADLATEERWEDLEQLAAQQLRPLEPSIVTGEPEELGLTDVELNAALAAFAMSSSRTHQRRAGWYPREVTGIEPNDEVAESDGS